MKNLYLLVQLHNLLNNLYNQNYILNLRFKMNTSLFSVSKNINSLSYV
jgi:hypothetical protein